MKNSDLNKLLKSLGLPVAYGKFKSKPKLPFIVFMQSGSNNFFADNKVFKKNNSNYIELYSEAKDFENEGKLEDLLDANEIPWEKSADIYISDEDLILIRYYI